MLIFLFCLVCFFIFLYLWCWKFVCQQNWRPSPSYKSRLSLFPCLFLAPREVFLRYGDQRFQTKSWKWYHRRFLAPRGVSLHYADQRIQTKSWKWYQCPFLAPREDSLHYSLVPWFLLFVFFASFFLCFSPFYSFRFIPAQILLPQQGCPPSHGRSTRSSSSDDCFWTDCTSSGRLPSYSERFTLEISTLTINESLHMSRLLNCLYIVKPLALQFSLKVRSSQYIETFSEYQYWSQKMLV